MSSYPSCAVLLATYNGSLYLKDQLISINNQKKVFTTIFISDDGSSDGSLELACNICHDLSQPFSVVLQDNRFFPIGSAGNFYHLLSQPYLVNFDYIALSDQDDIWHSFHLSRAIHVLIAGKFAGYSSSIQSFSKVIQSTVFIKKHHFRSQYNYLTESPGPGCSFVLPLSSFHVISNLLSDRSALVSQVTYHDWLIYALCTHFCGPWFVDSFCGVYYRQHSSNVLGDNRSLSAKYRRFLLLFGDFYVREIQSLMCLCSLEKTAPFDAFFKNGFFSRLQCAFFLFSHRSVMSHKFIAFVSALFFKIK